MRRIERTKAFKKDYQRAVATPKHRDLANLLPAVIALLATDTPLPEKYVDHRCEVSGRIFATAT